MRCLLSILTTILLFVFTSPAQAQQIFKYNSHTMTISGTSSLHDWVSNANKLSGSATITVEGKVIKGISWMQLNIPVKSIISSKGSIMDGKTHDALEADDHPDIVFKLTDITSITPKGQGYTMSAQGKLSMAGQSKTINMTVTALVGSDGSITFSGSKALKMTDFGISPPTAMLGTLKTGDDITIDFNLKLTK